MAEGRQQDGSRIGGAGYEAAHRSPEERAEGEHRLEERIRERAHRIWEEEGRPEGREREHWDMASELVAQQDGMRGTLERNPSHGGDDEAQRTQPVEPLLSAENLGDTPGLTDQGEERQFPSRDNLSRRTGR